MQLTGNPIWIECSGGSPPAGSSGYKILLKVISEDGNLVGAPFILPIAPDASGNADFDISGYVDQPVKAAFQYPLSGIVVARASQAFNVQLQAGERYWDSAGELQEVWGSVEASTIQMLKGGNHPRQISMMNALGDSFYADYVQGDQWLTQRPQGDQVHPTQSVKMCYMVPATKSGNLNIVVHYNDDTTNSASAAITLNKDYLYEFNLSPTQYGISLEPTGKKALYFTAQLDFGSGDTSQLRSFYFDWRYIERPIFLFFANSLGGIDDVYFSGNIKDLFQTSDDVAERPPLRDDTVYDGTLVPSVKTGQNRWSFNTGWKPITSMQYYRDLLLARQAWYLYSNVTVTTYSIIPVIIENAGKELLDRKNDLFSMEITVSEAHRSAFNFDNRRY